MAVLNRMDWYDLARTTNWTPKYVTEDELFPPKLSGEFGLPLSAWEIRRALQADLSRNT
jgi:toluene monooxygenase system protein A